MSDDAEPSRPTRRRRRRRIAPFIALARRGRARRAVRRARRRATPTGRAGDVAACSASRRRRRQHDSPTATAVRPQPRARAAGSCSTSSTPTACRASASTPSWSCSTSSSARSATTAPSCTRSSATSDRRRGAASCSPTTAATGRSCYDPDGRSPSPSASPRSPRRGSSIRTASCGRAHRRGHRRRRRQHVAAAARRVRVDERRRLDARLKRWPGWVLLGVRRRRPARRRRDARPRPTHAGGACRVDIEQRLACPICDGESVFESRNTARPDPQRDQLAGRPGRAHRRRRSSSLEQRYKASVLLVPKATGSTRWCGRLPAAAFVCAVVGLAFAFRRWQTASTRCRRRRPTASWSIARSSTSRSTMNPDQLAELEEERRFLLRSLSRPRPRARRRRRRRGRLRHPPRRLHRARGRHAARDRGGSPRWPPKQPARRRRPDRSPSSPPRSSSRCSPAGLVARSSRSARGHRFSTGEALLPADESHPAALAGPQHARHRRLPAATVFQSFQHVPRASGRPEQRRGGHLPRLDAGTRRRAAGWCRRHGR